MPGDRPIVFAGANVEGSLWVLIPKAAGTIALSVGVILLRFYSEFGEVSFFAVGFSVFIVALQVLMIVGLRFARRDEVHTTVAAKNDWLDKLAGLWLAACAFGAFFGWIAGVAAAALPEYQLPFYLLEIVLTIILPLLTMVPNVRYVSRNAAYVQIPILFFVTLLPMLVGFNALRALLQR